MTSSQADKLQCVLMNKTNVFPSKYHVFSQTSLLLNQQDNIKVVKFNEPAALEHSMIYLLLHRGNFSVYSSEFTRLKIIAAHLTGSHPWCCSVTDRDWRTTWLLISNVWMLLFGDSRQWAVPYLLWDGHVAETAWFQEETEDLLIKYDNRKIPHDAAHLQNAWEWGGRL